MSDDNKVVFLAYRNDTPTDTEEVLACTSCRNKTWKAVYRDTSQFPRLLCACCGQPAGHFGWVDPENA